MAINIFVLKGDLNWENRIGAFLFCRVYIYAKRHVLVVKLYLSFVSFFFLSFFLLLSFFSLFGGVCTLV